jgi:hypothetical protein
MRSLKRAARRTTKSAFCDWRDTTKAVQLLNRLERRADVFSARALRRVTFITLAAWTDAFRYRRSVATFVRLARFRKRRRAATGALARWRVAVATARSLRAAGVVAVARDARRATRTRFDAWRVCVNEASRLASSRVRVARARREARQVAMTRRIVRGWHRHAQTQTRRVRAFFSTHFARRRVVVARRATRAWRYAARDAARDAKKTRRAEAIVARADEYRVARRTRDALLAWEALSASRAATRRRAMRFSRRRERKEAPARFCCGARASRTSPPRDSPWTPRRGAARRGARRRLWIRGASRRRSRGASAA